MENSVPCKGFVKKFGRKHGNNFIIQFSKYQLGISEVVIVIEYTIWISSFILFFLFLQISNLRVYNFLDILFSFHFKERVPSKFAQT